MDVQIQAAIIQAIPQAFLSFGAVAAGVWAVYNYRDARRLEAARWMQQLYSDFYNTPRFDDLRLCLEYKYEETIAPLVQKRLTDRHLVLNDDEMHQLRLFDNFLNYFENILYLLEQKRVQRKDVIALFEYWLGLMRSDRYGALRGYLAFGFERLAKELKAKVVTRAVILEEFWAQASAQDPSLDASPFRASVRSCMVNSASGTDLQGRVFSLEHGSDGLSLLRRIDTLLGYDSSKPAGSPVVRRCVQLNVSLGRRVENFDAYIYERVQKPPNAG